MSCGRPEERVDRGAEPSELLEYMVGESLGAARLARLEMTDPTLIIEQIVIRCDQAGDGSLAQSSGCVDHDRVTVTADRVGGKHYPRDLGVDHALHHNCDLDSRRVDLDPAAISAGTLGPQRSPASQQCIEPHLRRRH